MTRIRSSILAGAWLSLLGIALLPALRPAPEPGPDSASPTAESVPAAGDSHLRRRIAELEYAPSRARDGDGLVAPNRAHDLRVAFRTERVDVAPRAPGADDPAWSLAWRTTGLGREDTIAEAAGEPVAAIAPRRDGGRVVYARAGFDEWYENTKEGLEQGFTIHERVPGAGALALRGRFDGLRPALVAAGDAIDLFAADGTHRLRYAKLLAWDADGARLASRFELDGDAIALVVDDGDARYPITIDPLLTSPSWTAEPNQDGAVFGVSVAPAGDVNGDGYSDVIVGAEGFDTAQGPPGAAFVYLGSPTGLVATPAWTVEADTVNQGIGREVATAGDVNGDGYSDVIVAAMFYQNGEDLEGRALVYHGSASGLATTPSWTVESNQANAWFGGSVATAGDVNGDGYADVIVGAFGYDNGQNDEGRAFVYHGSATGLGADPAWTAEPNSANANFGISAATAGDVNGDGFADVVVGAQGYTNGHSQEGRAYVYHGSASGLSLAAAWAVESNAAGARFGSAVSTAGDVNGDGFSDVVVGANLMSNGQTGEGRAFVYHGAAAGLAVSPAWTGESNQTGAEYGTSVSTAGDVNGDGFADVIVGADFYDNGQTNEGRAYYYEGSPVGLNTSARWTTESDQLGARYGVSVATAGDVNGDGYSDLIVGAHAFDGGEADEGRVFVFHGFGGGLQLFPQWALEGQQALAAMGSAVASAGDVNGDGYSDLLVAANGYDGGNFDEGRAFLHHGTTAGSNIAPNWTMDSNQQAAFLGFKHGSVAGAGDINGDGYEDVILGVPYYDNGQSDEGRVLVHVGASFGVHVPVFAILEIDQADAHFGTAVSSAGDVNGDGFADFIVGAEQASNGEAQEGLAYVYHGAPTGPTLAWIGESNQPNCWYGKSVAGAGDVNGDGYSDVIVGAERYSAGQSGEGRAFVYHGSPTGLATTPAWTAESDQNFADFGATVAGAGDVNGDGYADVIVGAPSFDGAHSSGGKAEVYLGSASGLSLTPAWSVESGAVGGGNAMAVASAGDVNGDGFSDVVVGFPFLENGQTDEGIARVYHGSASGPSLVPDWSAEGEQSSARFGAAVSSAGDTNGDGFSDLVVGIPGYDNGSSNEGFAWLYLGNERDGLERAPRQLRFDGVTPVAHLGRPDLESLFRAGAVGHTVAGRGRVRLEVELKPLGAPFDGTGLQVGPWTDTGTPNNAGSKFPLLHSITGLVPDAPYHWRARVASASPHFPRTAWFSPPGNAPSETDLRGGTPLTRLVVAFDGSVAEGNAGETEIVFTVAVDPSPYTTVTVDYATADGTATVAGGDYDATSGTLVFDPGVAELQVAVTVHGDLLHEFDEQFQLVLSNASAAVIEDAQATGTIADDGDPSTFVVCPELDVTDRQVEAMLERDGILYLGGSFTEVGPPTGCALSFDATTGAALGIPRVDGIVRAVAPDGAGGWYVGGDFTRVGGLARSYVAHIGPDHAPSAWDPGASGPVHALVVDGDRVLAAGKFTSIGGQPRNRIAALDAVSGAATAWNPDANGAVLALAVLGGTVYAGGSFTTIGGVPHENVVALDRVTGAPKPGWAFETDGAVRAIVADGDRVYIGGDFLSTATETHQHVAALDTTAGVPVPGWNAQANGSVHALALGAGVLYAGGTFGNVSGQARSRLVALDLATGAVTGWNPNAGATVFALLVSGATVYAGGDFGLIGGQPRRFLAALDATTGSASAWSPRPNHGVYAIAVAGSAVYAGGAFTSAAGQVRRGAAAIDLSTGHVTPWNPDVIGTVNDIDIAGNVVYLAGGFLMVGGVPRNCLAAVDRTTGALSAWAPGPNANVFDVLVDGSLVYVAGLFTTIAGSPRGRLASVDVATGFASPWNPDANGAVRAIAMDGGVLYASGDFTTIGGQPRGGLAALNTTTGLATSWDANPSGSVLALLPHDGLIYAAGDFGAIGGETRFGLAALDPATAEATPWNPDVNGLVEAIAVSGGTLYAGGAFPTVGGIPHADLAAIDLASGAAIPWIAGTDQRVLALAIAGDMVYAGGLFESVAGTMHSHLACVGPAQSTVDVAPIAVFTGPNLRLSPNPGTGGPTRIEFELPSAARVRVAVFDVRGRLVARPMDADRPAGRQAVAWNGEGTGGRVAPGIYFVRVEALDRVETSRLVRLR
jgi:hypothetical protein